MSHNRIDRRFAALAAEGRAAFVAYVMAGDPDPATALEIVRGLPGAGADLIEIGFPFSDPMAEGPPIQKAAQRALKGGMTLAGTLDLIRAFREGDADTPIVLMGYLNPIVNRGVEAFAPLVDIQRAIFAKGEVPVPTFADLTGRQIHRSEMARRQ